MITESEVAVETETKTSCVSGIGRIELPRELACVGKVWGRRYVPGILEDVGDGGADGAAVEVACGGHGVCGGGGVLEETRFGRRDVGREVGWGGAKNYPAMHGV